MVDDLDWQEVFAHFIPSGLMFLLLVFCVVLDYRHRNTTNEQFSWHSGPKVRTVISFILGWLAGGFLAFTLDLVFPFLHPLTEY